MHSRCERLGRRLEPAKAAPCKKKFARTFGSANSCKLECALACRRQDLSIQTVVPASVMWENAHNFDLHGCSFTNVEGNINYNAK
jgi:hypothetical protein